MQKGTDDPAFRFTLTGLDKFEIEFVDDKEELELDITKALVLSSFRWFTFFEMVNTLPNNMLGLFLGDLRGMRGRWAILHHLPRRP